MSVSSNLETSKLLFEAVKVMVPVLTAFLTFYAGGIGKLWEKIGTEFDRQDIVWISVISFFSVSSLGAWALTLAGAIVSTSGAEGLTIPFSAKEALIVARVSMGLGYWLFVCTLICSGYYFLKLSVKLRKS